MKKFLIILFLVITIIIVSGCTGQENVNMLKVSSSSDELVGENYQTVISELETIGFTNIETQVLDDLILGWLTKDGEVEQVEINGTTEFSANTSFPKDAKIIIAYHTFPKESDTDSTDKESSEPVGQSADESSKVSNQEILTVENNKDLATLLAVKDPSNPIVSEFAENYAGRTIEFNGNIAYMMNYGNYKTRYDFLIYAGDFSETTTIGPNFKFEDVNISDLHLTGSNIPQYIEMGQNLHITAKVEEYDEVSELFFLKPISTEIR
ncbi:MAG: DUF4839 domain-containing protein [Syntrophomonadaceae bacterium]|nr:DUF4839 domain-containing protein [Syntrophomonadaceae bacterium]